MPVKLRRRIETTHRNHKRIAAGALWVGSLVFLSKLVGAGRELVVAWRYGVSATVDAYNLALTITTWFPMLLGGIVTVVVVPRLVALRATPHDYRKLISELNGTILWSGIGIAGLTFIAVPKLSELLSMGLDDQTTSLVRSMAISMTPIALFVVLSGYLAARLQARERYGYSIMDALPPLLVIAFVIGAGADYGGAPLVWGTVVGFLLQCLLLAALTKKNDSPIGAVRFTHRSHAWWAMYQPLLVVGAGQVIITATIPIDQAFASSLGEGAVSAMGYAVRLIGLVITFGSVVFTRVLLPVLSDAVADGEWELGRRHALRWSAMIAGVGCAVLILGWMLAPFAVRTLFERGAFSAADTQLVAEILRFGLMQVPFFFGGIVLVQWFAAANQYIAILQVTIPALVVKVALNLALIGPFGIAGIMVATAAMYACTSTLMFIRIVFRYSEPRNVA
jgi:putative peptidoglycan lipid II flippase